MVIMIQLTRQMIIQFISILDIEVPIATISKTNMKTVCKCSMCKYTSSHFHVYL